MPPDQMLEAPKGTLNLNRKLYVHACRSLRRYYVYMRLCMWNTRGYSVCGTPRSLVYVEHQGVIMCVEHQGIINVHSKGHFDP